MNAKNYSRDALRIWIHSGWYTPEQVNLMLHDVIEDSDDEQALREFIRAEFEMRDSDEETWPNETDCDRLDRAFAAISSQGIVALQNAGYTTSDGHEEVGDVLAPHPRGTFKGYCFYHGQDLERVVNTGQLYVAFGDLQDTQEGKLAIGRLVRDAVRGEGLACDWNDDVDKRILITGIDWKRRRPNE